ncbi:hypothetical protein F5Y07DRAFT_373075 [Xylaria sp. FL0933]|nr:hypothetical protein F5Y07DRAFT_373075 [Xylaria sp. FL0933]
MRPPRTALPERGLFQPRDITVPAVCYDTCNNANLEAQAIGKTPELCSPDSLFMSYYTACVACLEANASDAQAITKDYLDPDFAQWLDYCGSTSPSLATTLVGEYTGVITILYTTTIDGTKTVWPLVKTVTTFAPRPDTAIVTIKTSQDGQPTTWIFTKTFTHLASDFLVSESKTTSNPSTGSDMSISTHHSSEVTVSPPVNTMGSESDQSARSSRAWIAGPVVGGVAGIAILVLLTWWLLVRSKKNASHEVHGESAIKSELEAKHQPQELESHEPNRSPVELECHNTETHI